MKIDELTRFNVLAYLRDKKEIKLFNKLTGVSHKYYLNGELIMLESSDSMTDIQSTMNDCLNKDGWIMMSDVFCCISAPQEVWIAAIPDIEDYSVNFYPH